MSASKGSMGESSKTNTSQNVRSNMSSTPTFDATGKSIIEKLAGTFNTGTGLGSRAGEGLLNLARSNEGGVNPYVEELIRTSNAEGNFARDTGLAQLRAGGYRGGTARNIYDQGDGASRYAAALAAGNAATRYGAYDAGQNRALSAYGGAAAAGNSENTSALQLLSLLRGEDSCRPLRA